MIHFTHTGFFAGVPYCGIPRNETDKFVHPPYNAMGRYNLLNSPDMCPKCKEIYNDAGDASE